MSSPFAVPSSAEAAPLTPGASSAPPTPEAVAAAVAAVVADVTLLEALIAYVPIGVLVAAPTGELLAANAAARALFHGYLPRTEGLASYGRYLTGRHADGRPVAPHEWPLARALQHGETVPQELLEMEVPGAGRRWFAIGAMPVRAPGGDIVAAVLTVHDLTERREAEARLQAREAELADALESMSDALFAYDRELRLVRVNGAARRWIVAEGLDPDAIVGRVVWEALPDVAHEPLGEALRRVLAEGAPAVVETRSVRTGRWVEARLFPTHAGVACYSVDVTERKRLAADAAAEQARLYAAEHAARTAAERAAARMVQLQGLASALGEALTLEDLGRVVVRQGVTVLGADAAFVMQRPVGAEHLLETVFADGYPPDVLEAYRSYDVDAPLPASEAVRTGRPVWLESPADRIGRFGERTDVAATGPLSARFPAGAVLPLVVDGQVLGAMGFNFRAPRRFAPDDRAFLAALAREYASALARTRAYEAERAARREAEQAATRAAALQSVASALVVARTVPEIADAILRLGMPALGATRGSVATLTADGEALEVVAIVGYGPEAREQFGRVPLARRFPPCDAARTRTPIFLATDAEREAHYPDLAALRRANGGGAMAALPLLAGDRVLGTLGFNFPEERPLGATERDFLLALAQQCAQALDRARLDAAERAARTEAERAAQVTSLITSHLADGVFLMDAAGRLTYMNPAAERILGWTAAELLGDVLHDRVHHRRPDGRPFPMEECPLGTVLREATPVLGLADQWVRKDGTFVHVVTTCTPIVDEGRVLGAVLSLHDDTERRRAEAERERLLVAEQAARGEAETARAEAEAANRAKSEFLAVMSHELRTPLNAILGYADLLDAGVAGPLADAQRVFVDRGRDAARRLLTLVEDVLSFAKLEAGRVAISVAPTPLRALVAPAVAVIAPQAAQRGLALVVADDAALDALHVRADLERAGQVLLNLLSNAMKFTPAGGRITVHAAADAQCVHVSVEDTGVGIAASQHERIFEPFVQVDTRLTRTSEGTGLGLAISRELARAMGGDVTVASAAGEGATFTLELPRVVPA